jgi:hypothetical protein
MTPILFVKKNLFFVILLIIVSSCQKDDLAWIEEISGLKAELADQRKIIDALQANANIVNIDSNDSSYTIYFSNGQSITLSNGQTPLVSIGENGNWFINGEDTGMPSKGLDGKTPSIEIIDGFWWINGENTSIKAEGADAPYITNVVDNGISIVFYFSDNTKIEVQKVGGYYLNALGESVCIATMGASLISYPNNWVESACNSLGISCYNKAEPGVGIPSYFAKKIWKKEYCTEEEFEKIDILVIQFANSKDLCCGNDIDISDFPQDGYEEKDYFSSLSDAECVDYILKYWQNWCYEQRNNPNSKWYATKFGKPFKVLFVTHWHDARTNYNQSIRKVAEQWGAGLCELDKNIGFTKNRPLPDGTQVSVTYALDTQNIDGVIYGWHPLVGTNGIYIQTRMANILIQSLVDNFGAIR